MPSGHRAFVQAVERQSTIREFVTGDGDGEAPLTDAYNACLRGMEEFRSIHLEYAASYIFRQAQESCTNPNAVGTGGTPFMPYLKKHRDETQSSQIGKNS
jgi:indoleamine 2,3-dioxygenase